MNAPSKDEVKIARAYPTVGLDGRDRWVVVEPGLFEYPIAEGEKPGLRGSQCVTCGKRFFPARPMCPDCFDQGSMKAKTFDNRGIVYCSTVVRVPSPVGIKPPYAYGYVDIPADDIRVFALFTGSDPELFAPGQEVELVLEPIVVNKQDQQVIGYKFKSAS